MLPDGMGRCGTITPLAPVRSQKNADLDGPWTAGPIEPACAMATPKAQARSREGVRHEPSFPAPRQPRDFVWTGGDWPSHGRSGRRRHSVEGPYAKHSASGCRDTQTACRRGIRRAGAVADRSEHEKHSAWRCGRKCGDQIAQMSDRCDWFASTFSASRPEVEIALRLQLGDPHHAAAFGGNKARQQILQRDILRLHGVAAGGEFEACPGELADAL